MQKSCSKYVFGYFRCSLFLGGGGILTNKNNVEIMSKVCFFFTFGAQFLVLFWVFDQYLLKRHTRELFGPPRAQAGRALRPSPHPGCTRESACPVRRLKVFTEKYELELSFTFGAHFFLGVEGF